MWRSGAWRLSLSDTLPACFQSASWRRKEPHSMASPKRSKTESLQFEATKPTKARRAAKAGYELDRMSALEIASLMNRQDATVSRAVRRVLPQIAEAMDLIAKRLRRGGRLIYVGTGTSGRIGALDAAECPPTFRVPPDQVQAILAGGRQALWQSIEGAEDD